MRFILIISSLWQFAENSTHYEDFRAWFTRSGGMIWHVFQREWTGTPISARFSTLAKACLPVHGNEEEIQILTSTSITEKK
ncbi:MAG TPA: hypothetical protein VL727_21110 [Puia sp.]|nr:hypothetical protein [Puia sp.]